MPNWRAVGFGVVVASLIAFTGILVPLIGHVMLGFAGGIVAGTLGARDVKSGAEQGVVTGVGSALLMTVLAIVILPGFESPIGAVLSRILPVLAPVFDLSIGVVVVAGAILVLVACIIGGIVGGVVRGDRTLPAAPPEDRPRNRR